MPELRSSLLLFLIVAALAISAEACIPRRTSFQAVSDSSRRFLGGSVWRFEAKTSIQYWHGR